MVLGGEGQVLDIGRASRIFPPQIRRAITVRDKGCAFPSCSMPAPWCEAHRIEYWSRGGPTSTANGTLLCTHYHLIHKEDWHIQVQAACPGSSRLPASTRTGNPEETTTSRYESGAGRVRSSAVRNAGSGCRAR